MSKNKQTIEAMTNKLIERMEQGSLVWNKPWTAGAMPQNYKTKHTYKG